MDSDCVTVQLASSSNPSQTVKVHFLKHQIDIRKFLSMCSEVLKIKAQRVFDQTGKEIRDISQIETKVTYFVTCGELFHGMNFPLKQSSPDQTQILYLISIMGMGSVGKSNITMRWVQNQFYEHYDPTLQDDYMKKVSVDDRNCVLMITDTCGQEEYVALRTQWMKGRDGLIFAYAINSIESFEDIKNTLELYKVAHLGTPSVVVIGNKVDLEAERVVTTRQGQELAQQYGGLFFETSAKTGHNVYAMFNEMVRDIIRKRDQATLKSMEQQVNQLNDKKTWCQLI